MFPESLSRLKAVLTTRDLNSEQIEGFLSAASQIKKNPESVAQTLKGKTILQFFVENTTRTRMSFETAVRKMGGMNVGFATASSSFSKGETLLDTVRTIRQYGVDAIVMRHSSGESPKFIHENLNLPVINAGDGQHEHPTQALLDAFTLQEVWGSLKNKTVLILGDILHSRVARSNIHALTKLGVNVILCAPNTLLPKDLSLFPKVEVTHKLDEVLSKADAVMCLRIQFERQSQNYFPSKHEYRHFWGLTVERAAKLKPNTYILHPGPMNRGLEIDSEVADSKHSLILKQVENGVWVRMAVLGGILR